MKSHRQAGFTLVELLVVIAIIGILVAITLAVGTKVAQGGRTSLTRDTIRILDKAWEGLAVDLKDSVPSKITDDAGTDFLLIDARRADGDATANQKPEPSLQAFLQLCEMTSSGSAMLEQIDSKLISRTTLSRPTAGNGDATVQFLKNGAPVSGLVVNDAYGNPIRMVHPEFDGGYGVFWSPTQVDRDTLELSVRTSGTQGTVAYRRSCRPVGPTIDGIGDADEGLCSGQSAYFYSSGPDADPGRREDNVYSVEPTFPTETRSLR